MKSRSFLTQGDHLRSPETEILWIKEERWEGRRRRKDLDFILEFSSSWVLSPFSPCIPTLVNVTSWVPWDSRPSALKRRYYELKKRDEREEEEEKTWISSMGTWSIVAFLLLLPSHLSSLIHNISVSGLLKWSPWVSWVL
jgi:hypothetical protein